MTTEAAGPGRDRRSFLVRGGVIAAGAIVGAPAVDASGVERALRVGDGDDAVSPPASEKAGTGLTRMTIVEAEKLTGVAFTDDERAIIVETIEEQIDRARKRMAITLPNGLAPAQTFDPKLPGTGLPADPSSLTMSADPGAPCPSRDEDIAYAPVTMLSRWIARRELTSARLTEICLDRLARIGPALECVVTLTPDLARRQAARADAELAAGRGPRSPLHGIPWGAKDLLDTAGIPTTWGAAPYRDRIAERDATVVSALDAAGAVLVAKLTLGALAYGDIWFGGKTRSPWNTERGSSGSSAGSAAATAAGLVPFAIGTETLGSIVSPCMRCGTTGLRPTFGRVSRHGAMALCWSLDKIGPIGRTVEDTALVLAAINGPDPGDPSSIDAPFVFDGRKTALGRRVGYHPSWFETARDLDRRALEAIGRAGAELVEIELPDWPYDTLMTILLVEAAAAFEPLTLDGRDDELVWQEPQAWPNTFRCTRFVPAIEYVQAERFRRKVMTMMAERFQHVDALISPSYAASLLLITNCTGHPSLTIRCGFRDDGAPHGITLWGRLFDEGTLLNVGMALERELDVSSARRHRLARPSP